MIRTKLGKSGYFVSKLALGTVQFGLDYGFVKKKTQGEVDAILDCAWNNGLNFIDTAREYGDSERKIGDFLSRSDAEFIVATKLKKLSESEASSGTLRGSICRSLEESLKELRLQNLQVLQLHQTDEYLVTNDAFWNVIVDLKKNRTIGAFGVSVYDVGETLNLTANYGDVIDYFQVPYNVFDRRFDELHSVLTKESITLVSRSTFLKGVIPCKMPDLPSELDELKPYKERLESKARDIGVSVSELALLYVYCCKHVGSTLVGVDGPEELTQNISVIKKQHCGVLENEDFSDLLVTNSALIDPRKWTNF